MHPVIATFASILSLAGAPHTYYVSPSGSDANPGSSPFAAWQSVERVNSAQLVPGDQVLFEGGQRFAGTLFPPASGTPGVPITFSSYGSGQANITGGIRLRSVGWLVLDNLAVDTGDWRTAGKTWGVSTDDEGDGAQNIVVRNSTFRNVTLGFLLSNHGDSDWTVTNNVVQYTRDSGILVFDPNQPNEVGGSNMTFTGNQILDTGLDSTLPWLKHGVYDIGTNIVWRGNTIRRFQGGGIALRAHGNVIEGNTIADGPYPIYAEPYDPVYGTTRIAYNRIFGVGEDAITIDPQGLVPQGENYVIANNTIVLSGGSSGVRIVGTNGYARVANNIVTAGWGLPLRIDTMPALGLTEGYNIWYRAAGAPYTSVVGRQAGGPRDLFRDPQLGPELTPGVGSPAVDAGTKKLDSTVSYVGRCVSERWFYCGKSVDMGAVELILKRKRS